MIGFGHDGWEQTVTSKEDCCSLCLADPKCTVAVFLEDSHECHGKTPETKPGRPSKNAWACRARPKLPLLLHVAGADK